MGVRLSLLLAGCFAVLVVSVSAVAVLRSQGEATVALTCTSIRPGEPKHYEPIAIGPVAFDPGPELSSGTQFRWIGHGTDGYIIKSFLAMARSAGKVSVIGRNVATSARLQFSYRGQGYEERLELDAEADRVRAAFSSPERLAFPGALAAPDLGVYRVTVESDGQTWSRTISICSPGNPPRVPS